MTILLFSVFPKTIACIDTLKGIPMKAAQLADGRWIARWAAWELLLDGHRGQWRATLTMVAPRPFDRPLHHVDSPPFDTAPAAAKWGADRLKERGQEVLLLGGSRIKTLVDMLRFTALAS